MSELKLNQAEFIEIAESLVPKHQLKLVKSAIISDSTNESDYYAIGLLLTGEKSNISAIITTGAPSTTSKSLWQYINAEIYELLCTSSRAYTKERKDGLSIVANLVQIVATAVAARFSIAVGVITGAVVVAINCFLKVGKTAWCKMHAPTPA